MLSRKKQIKLKEISQINQSMNPIHLRNQTRIVVIILLNSNPKSCKREETDDLKKFLLFEKKKFKMTFKNSKDCRGHN